MAKIRAFLFELLFFVVYGVCAGAILWLFLSGLGEAPL